jgi:hypothetical protein
LHQRLQRNKITLGMGYLTAYGFGGFRYGLGKDIGFRQSNTKRGKVLIGMILRTFQLVDAVCYSPDFCLGFGNTDAERGNTLGDLALAVLDTLSFFGQSFEFNADVGHSLGELVEPGGLQRLAQEHTQHHGNEQEQ